MIPQGKRRSWAVEVTGLFSEASCFLSPHLPSHLDQAQHQIHWHLLGLCNRSQTQREDRGYKKCLCGAWRDTQWTGYLTCMQPTKRWSPVILLVSWALLGAILEQRHTNKPSAELDVALRQNKEKCICDKQDGVDNVCLLIPSYTFIDVLSSGILYQVPSH